MSELPPPPGAARPGDAGPVRHPDVGPVRPFDASPAAVGASLAIAAGTALVGLVAGYGWSLVAPRALLVMVSHGTANLVQAETSAFIAADAAFCLIMVAGGVVSGTLGYLLGVRRYGPLAMAGVLAGALGAAFLARWAGEQSGLATFHHLLTTLPAGARLRDSLTLRAGPAIALWPLTACLVAGGMEAWVTRGRRRGGVGQPLPVAPGPGVGRAWVPGSPTRPARQPDNAPGMPGSQPGLE
jgi:hypothetical protein